MKHWQGLRADVGMYAYVCNDLVILAQRRIVDRYIYTTSQIKKDTLLQNMKGRLPRVEFSSWILISRVCPFGVLSYYF